MRPYVQRETDSFFTNSVLPVQKTRRPKAQYTERNKFIYIYNIKNSLIYNLKILFTHNI